VVEWLIVWLICVTRVRALEEYSVNASLTGPLVAPPVTGPLVTCLLVTPPVTGSLVTPPVTGSLVTPPLRVHVLWVHL
jgi:hypothetical protein